MTGLAPSRVEIQARLEQALAERIPVAIATVVRGGQVEDEPPVRRFVAPSTAA